MRYVALYPFYVVCVAGVLFRGVAQTSGKAARLNGEKLVLTLDTDLIHSRAHLSNSALELKTKFRACSAFVCAPFFLILSSLKLFAKHFRIYRNLILDSHLCKSGVV